MVSWPGLVPHGTNVTALTAHTAQLLMLAFPHEHTNLPKNRLMLSAYLNGSLPILRWGSSGFRWTNVERSQEEQIALFWWKVLVYKCM